MPGKRDGRQPGTGEADPAIEAQVDRALSALEDLVLSGRAADIPRWTAVLWHNRLETERVLLRRLANGTVRVPALFLEVLAGLGGARAGALLRQVAANRGAPDLLRLEARRRAGWPAGGAPRARLGFLRTLRDPLTALRAYAAMACGHPVPDGETSEELLAHLLALPGAERAALAARLSAELGPGVAWLLRGLLAAPDAATRELAVAELLDLRDRGAAAALDRLARSAAPARVRAAAEVAVRRLSLRVVRRDRPGSGTGKQAPGRRPPQVRRPGGPPALAFDRALISAVDGQGTQIVGVVWSWDADTRLVVQFGVGDEGGLVAVGGSMRVPREQAQRLVQRAAQRGRPVAGATLAEARTAVLWAAERHLRGGTLPPPAFALWEPYLYEGLVPEPAAAAAPGAAGLRLDADGGPPAERAVEELLSSPFCAGWQFSAERVAAVLRELGLAEPAPGPRYTALLAALCTPQTRALLGERLRRQAWVLDRCGRRDLRDAALGCARQVEVAAPEQLADLPLLRGMLARGLRALRLPGAPARR
jgi:hypothetical protein